MTYYTWGNEKQKIHEEIVCDFSPRVREIIDKKRFISKIGEISGKEYKEIQKKIKKLYF